MFYSYMHSTIELYAAFFNLLPYMIWLYANLSAYNVMHLHVLLTYCITIDSMFWKDKTKRKFLYNNIFLSDLYSSVHFQSSNSLKNKCICNCLACLYILVCTHICSDLFCIHSHLKIAICKLWLPKLTATFFCKLALECIN